MHERVEIIYFVFFYGLIVNFKTCLEQIVKQFNFFLIFSSEMGNVVLRDLDSFGILFMMLLKLAELLLLANRWRANKIWSASIAAGVFSLRNCGWLVGRTFLFAWRSPWGALGRPFLNTCHHVSSPVWIWINWMKGLTGGGSHLRMSIILGMRFFWFLVSHVRVPEGSRKWSIIRTCRLRRSLTSLDSAPKICDSVLLKYWVSFLMTLPTISSEACLIYSSLIFGTDVFSEWPFHGCSFCVFLATTAKLDVFLQCCHLLKAKGYAVVRAELVFFQINLTF